MRKVALFLVLSLFILTGCDNKPMILFNKSPITKETVLNDSKVFSPGDKIYYIFIHPKKLKSNYITVEVIKKDTKVEFWAYKKVFADEYKLRRDQIYYYEDYVVLYEPGLYFLQVKSRLRPDKVIAKSPFWVQN